MDGAERLPMRSSVRSLARMTPFRWLLLLLTLYAAAAFTLSVARLWELQTDAWDLGIYQQSLWSTSHGAPFFEAPDLETGAFATFLEVHSAFVLYLLVPLYSAAPSPVTLFAVQTGIVAAAAIPLFVLTRDLTGSGRRALLVGGLYLLWAPTIGGNLFDFHVESFLPLEFFALAVLWNRRQYGWGFAVAGLAFLSLEVAPVLAVFFALFFLARSAWPDDATRRPRGVGGTPLQRLRRFLTGPDTWPNVALIVVAVGAYYLLLFVRMQVLESLFHLPPFPPATGYVIGATPGQLGLQWSYLSIDFQSKVTYWIVLYALVGFIPLLDRRTLILPVPWVVFTLFTWIPHYSFLANQDGFVAAVPVMIGLAFGAVRLPKAVRFLEHLVGTGLPPSESPAAPRSGRWRRLARRAPAWTVPLLVLVALNVGLSPLNPYMQGVANTGGGYRISYSIPPGYGVVQDLAAMVPGTATVVASDMLFPLIANDPHAYSLFTSPNHQLFLPFNSSALPTYAFLAEARLSAVPVWLAIAVYNASEYGLEGLAWQTPAGPVLLFERGLEGPTVQFGTPPSLPANYSSASFQPGPDGFQTTDPTASWSSVVSSIPGGLGSTWSGPGTEAPSGNLSVLVEVRVAPVAGAYPSSNLTGALTVALKAFGAQSLFQHTYAYGALGGGRWVAVSFSVGSPLPLLDLEFQGSCDSTSVVVELGFLVILPA
ncbi:MAG: DUF2079 domain-containing protein [Thermoplasmata archaeon]|nr:DUF2079 domain-containing protein [Thermoplasmata archaeon]